MTKKPTADMPCKPCWELKYCPYGYLVEYSPFATNDYSTGGRDKYYREAMDALQSGELKDDDEVWGELERVLHLNPGNWEEIEGYSEKDIGCKIFGHVCPMSLRSFPVAETGSAASSRVSAAIASLKSFISGLPTLHL